jgi:hypothetical protein
MDAGDREALLQADRDEAAASFLERFPTETPPKAQFVRAVEPSEWSTQIAACMSDAGFTSRPDGQSVLTNEIPAEQELAHARATFRCRVAYPIDPRFRQAYTADEAEFLYDYLVTELVPCLEDEGQPNRDIPSFETFLDRLANGDEWTPYESVAPTSDAVFTELLKTCPQKPRGFRGN